MKHINEEYINILYELVVKSNELDEIPVGSIVIKDGIVIGKGFNNRQSMHNVCGHAEINAIIDAENTINDWRLNGCILITTLYPCDMCQGAIKEARIDDVFYIYDGKDINNQIYNKIYFPGNKKVEKIREIFDDFFKKMR